MTKTLDKMCACVCVCGSCPPDRVCVFFFVFLLSHCFYVPRLWSWNFRLTAICFSICEERGFARVLPESGLGSGSGWIKLHFDDFVGVKRVKFFPMAPAKYASLDVEGTHLTTRLSV